MLDQFYKLGDVDTTFARFAANAPAVKQAEAKLETARRDLAQAELDLRYCDITADIDGVVTRRNVNPGNFVQVGQNLMAIRSLSEIWVDANFKETQLRDLRIGQPVDLRVDMYGDKQIFKGRISGFTEGTGSTLALLPPENATGNFIKVVQRLPVRIDLLGCGADLDPQTLPTRTVTEICSGARVHAVILCAARQMTKIPRQGAPAWAGSRALRVDKVTQRREHSGEAMPDPLGSIPG
jgi:membrane fusion protein (multidrug efflux system)